jgi:lysozyme family protein
VTGRNELRLHVTRLASCPGQPKPRPYRQRHVAKAAVTPTPNSRPDLASQLALACLGAGVITTVAVAQGQSPLTALGITLFSGLAAVMVGQIL